MYHYTTMVNRNVLLPISLLCWYNYRTFIIILVLSTLSDSDVVFVFCYLHPSPPPPIIIMTDNIISWCNPTFYKVILSHLALFHHKYISKTLIKIIIFSYFLTLIFLAELSYCKFCIYTLSINLKFTTGQRTI